MADTKEKILNIFISYSHDSPEHKKWVSELACLLIENGVQVIFDQWDLGYGDDVPKFMEKSVNEADRVLMICTETYVRKADDGKGGVGYEAMIVTGELIKDLGTNKFIPVIKQNSESPVLPKSLSTRLYVNLSDEASYKENFNSLLKELHKYNAVVKPPLGTNPFKHENLAIFEEPNTSIPLENITVSGKNIVDIYHIAQNIVRREDMIAWRKLIKEVKKDIPLNLNKWRVKYERGISPSTVDDRRTIALEGILSYAPLFAVSLAGIESGNDRFVNQTSFLDEIHYPKDWNGNGLTRIVHLPQFAIFIFHSLHGALCMQTQQVNVAINLACTSMRGHYSDKPLPLYKNHEMMGWSDILGDSVTDSWKFLTKLSDNWIWLKDIFGDTEDYKISLSAYYMALNIYELADHIASEKKESLNQDEIELEIPVCFFIEKERIQRMAYNLLISDKVKLSNVWKHLKLSDEDMQKKWPAWTAATKKWANAVYRRYHFGTFEMPHQDLFRDMTRKMI